MQKEEEVWDDSIIQKLFHEAILTHRTSKGQSASSKKRKHVEWGPPQVYSLKKEEGEELEEGEEDPELEIEAPVHSSSAHISPSYPPEDNGGGHHSGDQEGYMNSSIRAALAGKGDIAEEALSTMLMAWYQSGYATGRYQTLLEMQRKSEEEKEKGGK